MKKTTTTTQTHPTIASAMRERAPRDRSAPAVVRLTPDEREQIARLLAKNPGFDRVRTVHACLGAGLRELLRLTEAGL